MANFIIYYSRKVSGMGPSECDIKKICKGAAFAKGLAIHGADAAKSKKIILQWAKDSI